MNRRETNRPGVEGTEADPPRDAQTRGTARVVVLSLGAAEICALEIEGVRFVRAPTPYDAAAEILSAPTAALVVELRLLRGRHLRVLEIARQMDVEVLAVGTVPGGLTSEDLSGVRLTARGDLPEVLFRLTAPVRPPSPTPDEIPAPTVARSVFHGQGGVPGEQPVEDLGDESPIEPSMIPETSPPAQTSSDEHPTKPVSPSDLLTREELSALLEDEP